MKPCARCQHTEAEHTHYGCAGQPTGFGRKLCMCWWYETEYVAPPMDPVSINFVMPMARRPVAPRRFLAVVAAILLLASAAHGGRKPREIKEPALIILCEYGYVVKNIAGVIASGSNCVMHDKVDGNTSAVINVYNDLGAP